MHDIFLVVGERSVIERWNGDDDSKVWFEGGGFRVWVSSGHVKTADRFHQIQHAACVAVQAACGHSAKLRYVRKRKTKHKASKHLSQAREHMRSMFDE